MPFFVWGNGEASENVNVLRFGVSVCTLRAAMRLAIDNGDDDVAAAASINDDSYCMAKSAVNVRVLHHIVHRVTSAARAPSINTHTYTYLQT